MNGPVLVSIMISSWLICYLIVEYCKAKTGVADQNKTDEAESDSDDSSIAIPEDLE